MVAEGLLAYTIPAMENHPEQRYAAAFSRKSSEPRQIRWAQEMVEQERCDELIRPARRLEGWREQVMGQHQLTHGADPAPLRFGDIESALQFARSRHET